MVKKAQFKIQQMAFMILAVFFFFILIGLFFLNYQLSSIKDSYTELKREEAVNSLQTITNMPELSWTYESDCAFCLDEDKLIIMSGTDYFKILPVSSIEVRKLYPFEEQEIECPALNCNYYRIYDSDQTNIEEQSVYVSLCKRIKESNYVYDNCTIAKLSVGIEKNEI